MMIKNFEELCQSKGFGLLAPGYYARCYGAGLFQVVFADFSHFSDEEVRNNNQSCIRMVIESLYANLGEYVLAPESKEIGFSVVDLAGVLRQNPRSCDIESYDFMKNTGFDLLDGIDTHQKLLIFMDQLNEYGNGMKHRVIPIVSVSPETYLTDGNTYEAQIRLTHIIADNLYATINSNGHYKGNGTEFAYIEIIETEMLKSKREYSLWDALLGRKNDKIRQHLLNQYAQNMQLLQKYGVPIHPDFCPASIPENFF